MKYRIEFIAGHSSTDHFGPEILRRAGGPFGTLAEARRAVKAARKAHSATHRIPGGSDYPRIDVVRADERRFAWA